MEKGRKEDDETSIWIHNRKVEGEALGSLWNDSEGDRFNKEIDWRKQVHFNGHLQKWVRSSSEKSSIKWARVRCLLLQSNGHFLKHRL